MTRSVLLSLVALVLCLPAPAIACGPQTDCTLGERTYRIAVPDGDGPFGAILYLHGYRGTAAGAMGNEAIRQMAREENLALIAAKSGGEDWLIRNAPRKGFDDDTRELVYFDALLDDVSERFSIDPARIVVAGFSAGGMMTWTLACHRAGQFAGFVPIAGTFWAPIPPDCPSPPADLIHIHGLQDAVVPLEGRPIADTAQGDVRQALAMYAPDAAPADARLSPTPELTCEEREAGGARLALCLHEGGHSISAEWLRFAYRALVEQ